MIRRRVSLLPVIAASLVGVCIGRWVIPEFEGRHRVGIGIEQDKGTGCAMRVAIEETTFGRVVSSGEGPQFTPFNAFTEVADGVRVRCVCEGRLLCA